MLDIKDKDFFKEADGKSVDFYLEDDMFEIEGRFAIENGEVYIYVVDAVSHMLKIAGNKLKVAPRYDRFTATRTEDGKTFDLEINRVFIPLVDPSADDFKKEFENGTTQFFNKPDDTLVWYDSDEQKWFMEVNKINMYSSGDIHKYDSLEELFDKGEQYTKGKWQCIYFSAEVEEDEGGFYFG